MVQIRAHPNLYNYRQKWLAVIDLKDTAKVKTDRKLGRSSKYEVKTVLWNPHHVNKDLLVSTVSSSCVLTVYLLSQCMLICALITL